MDDATGMQMLGARYYLPALGRFLTQNPIGHEGGLNLYAYCENSPLLRVDPDGTDWDWAQYWGDVGGVFKGYGSGAVGMVTGPYHLYNYYSANGVSWNSTRSLGAGMWSGFVGGFSLDAAPEHFGESMFTALSLAAPGLKRVPLAFTSAGRAGLASTAFAEAAVAAGTSAGNYGLGTANIATASQAAVKFLSGGGKTGTWHPKYKYWRSNDGLRQIRFGNKKKYGLQMNFESRATPSGKFGSNGHLTIRQ